MSVRSEKISWEGWAKSQAWYLLSVIACQYQSAGYVMATINPRWWKLTFFPHASVSPFSRKRAKSSKTISSSCSGLHVVTSLKRKRRLIFKTAGISFKETCSYASSWMRLVSTATPWSASFLGLATAVGGRLSGGLSSGGFECIKMNGSSATRSLKVINVSKKKWILEFSPEKSIEVQGEWLWSRMPYPPKAPRQSFTFTLYCTIIPRFSFCTGSVNL